MVNVNFIKKERKNRSSVEIKKLNNFKNFFLQNWYITGGFKCIDSCFISLANVNVYWLLGYSPSLLLCDRLLKTYHMLSYKISFFQFLI